MKILRRLALAAAFGLSVLALWIGLGLPIGIDRLCIRSDAPQEGDFIVCVGAGLTTGNLPTDDGWGRIYTAVQLYLDGYGSRIVFTGGGSGRISEAEVYAEAARWLGLEEGDEILDPGPNRTSEHPANVLALEGAPIGRPTPLNIVTSRLHSKRTALCFRKAGFSSFRLVTAYRATGRRTVLRKGESVLASRPGAAPFLRAERTTALPEFRQSDKVYNDVFIRLQRRFFHFFGAAREAAALAAYKLKGFV